MENDLKISINEMKRLMLYDRSNGRFLTEQGKSDNLMPGQSDNPMNVKDAENPESPFYRQKFVEYKGFFDNKMPLGEFFDVTYFGSNDNATTVMDIPNIKKDVYGYYFEEDNLRDNNLKVRIYLPKDEWFAKFDGCVKSFVAYYTYNEKQEKPQAAEKYTLLFQLLDPKRAVIVGGVQLEDRVVELPDDGSRGWSVAFFGKSGSGYFTKDVRPKDKGIMAKAGEYIRDVTTPSFINAKGEKEDYLAPTEVKELTKYKEWNLVGYSEEYGRSDFDIWYDSGWGTFFQFAIPIFLSIVTGGISTYLQLGYRAALALEVGIELTFGIVEGQYLYERGETTAAALALIFAFVPLMNETKFLRNLAGAPADYDKFLSDFIEQGEKGAFKTPADFKDWLNKLPKPTKQWVENALKNGAEAMQKKGSKEIQERITKTLNEVIDEIKTKKGITKEIYDKAAKEGLEKPMNVTLSQTLKSAASMLGINLGVMGALYVPISALFPDDEEFKSDPQKLLDKVAKRSEIIANKAKELQMDTQLSALITKVQELEKRLRGQNPSDEDLSEYYHLFKDTALSATISSENLNTIQSSLLRKFYNDVIKDFEEKFESNYQNRNYQSNRDLIEIAKDFLNGKSIVLKNVTSCPTYTKLPFTTKEEVCEFGTWLLTTYPNSKYPKESDPNRVFPIESCEGFDKLCGGPFSAETYLNYCGYKYAYSKVGETYKKIKGTTTKQPTDSRMGSPSDSRMGSPSDSGMGLPPDISNTQPLKK